jgi:predicted CxxxxCH...CXXCH cytochrome family protein
MQRPRAAWLAVMVVAFSVACGGEARQVTDAPSDCSTCHGGLAAVAPLPVGAHRAHVQGGAFAGPYGCEQCHPIPAHRLHADGRVNVAFGPIGAANGAPARWDPVTATCSETWCHGRPGRAVDAPQWNAGAGAAFCGSCHGLPPGPPHPAVAPDGCRGCHVDTIREDGTIDVAGGKHVNGAVEGGCGGCHALPPASGAHAVHLALGLPPDVATYGDLRLAEDHPGAPGYAFGCGHCHPLDFARHAGGGAAALIDLAPAGAPPEGLKARNAADAAFDGASGTCSGTWCHSSGQAEPVFAVSPAWRGGPGPGCAGCHGNPPRQPNGGPGSATANSHLALADDGYEWGHFAGLPGPFHGTKHGGGFEGEDAAPITCQTCHAETVDPASTGPSGFYWLDTTGDYDLGGALGYRCGACHAPGDPVAPTRSGAVRPLRHVNGRRDVDFDARATLSGFAAGWLPGAPDTPTRPYWVTNAAFSESIPAGGTVDGATYSVELSGARYDPATKTCTGVACHLGDAPVWGRAYTVDAAPPATTCCRCHGTICG